MIFCNCLLSDVKVKLRRGFVATHPIYDFDRTSAVASCAGDSHEKLLDDIMHEVSAGLEGMPTIQRTRAIVKIHSIAEDVRNRQAKSAGQ